MTSKKVIRAALFIALFLGSGCTYSYNVQSHLPRGLPAKFFPGDSFWVEVGHNPQYPHLANAIESKVALLLKDKGYKVGSRKSAKYVAYISYSINEREGRQYVPGYLEGDSKTGRYKNTGYWQTNYDYTRKIMIKVEYARITSVSPEPLPVWTGFTENHYSTNYRADANDHIREFCRMLVAVFEQFDKATDKAIPIKIEYDDPRLQMLLKAK